MKITQIQNIFFVLSLALVPLCANQPSFDCSKVKKDSAEGIICSSDALMDLDRELSKVYHQALKKASKEDMLKTHQRGWIKGRNDCWKAENEAQCMEDAYHLRIDELKGKYALGAKKTAVEKYTFQKTLSLQGITFDIVTTGEGSLRQLYIKPHGLTIVNETVSKEIDGRVVDAEIEDLNKDGFPEVYVYIASAGSGSYGSLVAYASNRNKSMTAIYLPPLEEDKERSQGYMGHDMFSLVEHTLARRFPIYKKDDSNAKATGGTRQLEYKLKAGEAGWVLKLVKSTDFK
ncbi:MAG: hypothetical protein COB07_00500 [Sulfurovum sp.]|nr:MAG: hypothetical protein COB07_00500 [Sulfurovum sp.]